MPECKVSIELVVSYDAEPGDKAPYDVWIEKLGGPIEEELRKAVEPTAFPLEVAARIYEAVSIDIEQNAQSLAELEGELADERSENLVCNLRDIGACAPLAGDLGDDPLDQEARGMARDSELGVRRGGRR